MKEKVALVGGGGHCKVVIDTIITAGTYIIEGVIDPGLPVGEKVLGVPVLGGDELLSKIYNNGVRKAFIAVGSVGNCGVRKILYNKIKNIGFDLPVIVHPKAVIANDVKLGEGVFIAASSTINPGVEIGKNAIINTSSSIDHDCKIGDFVHIAPGVVLSGGVSVGEETHIGTGTDVIQGVKIGKRCFIPAGSLVKNNIIDNSKLKRD